MVEKNKNISSKATSDKQEVVAEKSPKKSESKGEYREGNMEYMKNVFPDAEINDDNYAEMMDRTMSEHVRPRMESYNKANNNLKAMVNSEPKFAMILGDMAKGAKFEEALPRYLDTRNLKLMPGDPDYTTWEANNKTRETNYAAEQEYKKKIDDNKKKSEVTITDWYEKKGMDDAAKKEYGMFVANSLDRAYAGEMDEDFLDKMYYAMNYKNDVAKAEEVGTIKGKNDKIVEEKLKEKNNTKGDGMPVIDGGVAKVEETTPETGNALEKGLRMRGKKKSVIPGNY